MRIASVIGNIVTQTTGGSAGPQAMWPGYIDSTSMSFWWWPPTTQTTWITTFTVASWSTGSVGTGAVGLTLSVPWSDITAVRATYFVAGSSGNISDVRMAQFTNGSTAVTWTGGLDATPQATIGVAGVQGTPDYYKIYRDGVLLCGGTTNTAGLLQPGVTATATIAVGQASQNRPNAWFVDRPVVPGVNHQYTVTAVTNNVETTVGPVLSMTALANGASVPPNPPVDPSTWVQDGTGALNLNTFKLPVGGTVWTCTNTASTAVIGSNPPVGNIGCSLGWALGIDQGNVPRANVNGGDIIVLNAGATYPVPPGNAAGYTIPAFNGTNGWTYIISSQEPVYQASIGGVGTLPAYSFSNQNFGFQVVPCTGTQINAAATSATATVNWTGPTGRYYCIFIEGTGTAQRMEERYALLTNGSATIDWSTLNPLYPSAGLTAAVLPPSGFTTPVILVSASTVGTHNYVNPLNVSSMPTIQFGAANQSDLTIIPAASKVRFVGLNLQPTPGVAQSALTIVSFTGGVVPPAQCDHIYFDRCLMGNDTNSVQWSQIVHGFGAVNCNHFLAHQCYIWGISNAANPAGDANNYVVDGQFHCWQNNYFQVSTESLIYGGSGVGQFSIPQDIVVRYNFSHKPASWIVGQPTGTAWLNFGRGVKNHFEVKCGDRYEAYGNMALNCWVGVVGGYHSAPFAFGARDQVYSAIQLTNSTGAAPWVYAANINAHDNQLYNIGSPFYAFTGDITPSCVTRRLRFANNLCYLNPLLPNSERVLGMRLQGPIPDLIIDHNTLIVNTVIQDTSTSGLPWGMSWAVGGATPGGTVNSLPLTLNNWDNYQDRATITNNIIDSGAGGTQTNLAFNFTLAGGLMFGQFPNLICNKNLTISDTATTYQGTTTTLPTYVPGTINAIPYGSIGFTSFLGNTAFPLHPSDWNVTTGAQATASTTGGPLGAIFPGSAPLFLGNSMQGITIATVSTSPNFNLLQFQGTDTKYGNVLPRAPASLWGGTGGNDQIQQLYATAGDITEAIVTDNTVPAGVSNQVRQVTLVNPYSGTFFTQDSYIEFPGSAPQGMAYESMWIFYQNDLQTRTGGSNRFAEVAETKTPGNTNVERFQVGWWMTNWTGSGPTVPTWVLFHDDGTGNIIYMEDILSPTGINAATNGRQTYTAPMPVGQWFRLEWAFNRSDSAGQGWMWMALTIPGSTDPNLQKGIQVFAARGAFTNGAQTLGLNAGQPTAQINRIFLDNCSYTNIVRSSSSTFVIKTTDIQLYAGWPATATAHPGNYN